MKKEVIMERVVPDIIWFTMWEIFFNDIIINALPYTHLGQGIDPLTKMRFSKINGRVRSRTAKTVNLSIANEMD